MQGPCIDRAMCIDRAGSVQGLTVQGVCIKCSLCRNRAGTVHGVFFCCCMTVHRLSGAKRPTCHLLLVYSYIEYLVFGLYHKAALTSAVFILILVVDISG